MKKENKTIISRVVILAVYLLVGGAIFQLLEKAYQASVVRVYEKKMRDFVQKYNISDEDMAFLETMINHEGKHSVSTEWNYGNAVFFAGSTVLTVGYGNIVPKTVEGKVFCMVYALFGIPFACLALKSLGEKMMNLQINLIRISYKRLCNKKQVSSIHLKATILNFFLTIVVILAFGGMTLLKRKDWTYFEGVYFVFITFTTIGFGDYVPSYENGFSEFDVIALILSVFIGFSLVSSLVCSISATMEEYDVQNVIKRAKTKMEKKRGRNADLIEINKHYLESSSAVVNDTEDGKGVEWNALDDLQVSLQRITIKRNSFQVNGKEIEIDQFILQDNKEDQGNDNNKNRLNEGS